MVEAYDGGTGGSGRELAHAEAVWPTVVATEDLAYRILAACWSIQHSAEPAEGPVLDPDGARAFMAALEQLAAAVRTRTPPAAFAEVPTFGSAELNRLRDSLVRDSG